MLKIKVRILSHSNSNHVQQVYTGFKILSDMGIVDLHQEIHNPPSNFTISSPHLANAIQAHVRVIASYENKEFLLHYDNHDSCEVNEEHLKNCDFYFKRSYDEKYILKNHSKYIGKISPLGLNYFVLPNNVDLFALKRNVLLPGKFFQKVNRAIRALDSNNYLTYNTRLRDIQSFASSTDNPKILFMVTAYDPYDSPDREQNKIDERIYNNEFRANCIKELRKEFGASFTGGFMHNSFTTNKYKNLLINDKQSARKDNYLKILDDHSICIATTGLHDSIGWKFAEYISFSKAIVSEKLHYKVPGNLRKDNNYLEFESVIECVEQTVKLVDNRDLRSNMMLENLKYYNHYTRPDMLILNSLLKIFEPHSEIE